MRKGEIEGRLDPNFYRAEFQTIVEAIEKFGAKKLSDLVETSSESWNGNDFFDDNFPYIEISEIDIFTGEIKNISSIPKAEAPSRAKMIVRNNDIIVSTTRPSRGAISFVEVPSDEINIASTGFAVLRDLKSKDISKEFLFVSLRQSFSLKQMEQRSSGGNYPAITGEELQKIKIPVPPIEVQTRIIEKFEAAYRAKRAKETEAKSLLDGIDAYLLERLGIETPALSEPPALAGGSSVGEDASSSTENPPANAGGSDKSASPRKTFFYRRLNEVTGNRFDANSYNAERLAAIEAVKNGKYSFGKLKSLTDFSKTIVSETDLPYIGMENIESNTGNYIETSEKQSFGSAVAFSEHQILFPKLRPYLNKVYYAEFDGVCSTEFHILDSKTKDLTNEFLSHFLRSRTIVSQTKHLMSGNTLPRLQTEDIENLLIPLPPRAVQEEIAAHVQSIRQRAKELEGAAKQTVEQAKAEVERMILGAEN